MKPTSLRGSSAPPAYPPLGDLSASIYEVNRYLASRETWRVLVNQIPIAELPGKNFVAEVEFGKPIFTFWSEDFSQSWRIEGYKMSRSCLSLQLTRKMRRERIGLELRPVEAPEEDVAGSSHRRRRYTHSLVEALRSSFPSVEIERANTGHGSLPGISSVFARVLLRSANKPMMALGVDGDESDDTVALLLSAGLIWKAEYRGRSSGNAQRCLLVVPEGRSRKLARQMTMLKPEALDGLALYEMSGQTGTLTPVQPTDQGSLFDASRTRLPRAFPMERENRTRPRTLPPLPTEARVYSHRATGRVSVRYKGLELGRLTARGWRINRLVARATGVTDSRCAMGSIAEKVAAIRSENGNDRWHPLYRLQGERWLEGMVREDLTRIDPRLDPRFVYPQIPAHDDHERGMVDLLAIQENGRLVIIELKVNEDLQLPLQALDYWLRVEWHRRRGDFERRGYFPGMAIAQESPMLYLVAPLFRFHRGFRSIASAVSSAVPLYRIAINEGWRSGIKVLRRERLNSRMKEL